MAKTHYEEDKKNTKNIFNISSSSATLKWWYLHFITKLYIFTYAYMLPEISRCMDGWINEIKVRSNLESRYS